MAKHLFPPGNFNPKDLEKFGPRLEIAVGPPIVHNHKNLAWLPNPARREPSRMPALVGASRTVLTQMAVQSAGLSVIDYTKLSRAGGVEEEVAVHVASIQFPRYDMATIEVIPVLCCELPEQPIQCLIGRDILSHWLFTYDGKTGQWCIEEEDAATSFAPPEGLSI